MFIFLISVVGPRGTAWKNLRQTVDLKYLEFSDNEKAGSIVIIDAREYQS
jgi:hypothetical protein